MTVLPIARNLIDIIYARPESLLAGFPRLPFYQPSEVRYYEAIERLNLNGSIYGTHLPVDGISVLFVWIFQPHNPSYLTNMRASVLTPTPMIPDQMTGPLSWYRGSTAVQMLVHHVFDKYLRSLQGD